MNDRSAWTKINDQQADPLVLVIIPSRRDPLVDMAERLDVLQDLWSPLQMVDPIDPHCLNIVLRDCDHVDLSHHQFRATHMEVLRFRYGPFE